jgi:hypothetical protein
MRGPAQDEAMTRWGLVLVIALGCGSDPQDGDTGLREDLPLAGLTLEEWKQVCKVIDTADRQTPDDVCRQAAFSATRTPAQSMGSEADVRATCQTTYDGCVRDARPARPSTCASRPLGPDCAASVGEAEQCLGAIITRRRADAMQVPACEMLTLAQASTAGTLAPVTDAEIRAFPTCAIVDMKCPDFFR